jgi:hypothetical protein
MGETAVQVSSKTTAAREKVAATVMTGHDKKNRT